jgi:coatomer protein complex subunit gamma
MSSNRSILKFAAIRTLNKLAQTHPTAVAVCNTELEAMITEQNRSMATMAITTLLKVRRAFFPCIPLAYGHES